MPKVWVEDTWKATDGTHTARYGTGSRWKGYWYETSRVNGRAVQLRRSKRFRTKVEAEQFLETTKRALDDGSHRTREQQAVTFGEAAEEWLATRHSIKASTHRRYRRDMDNYVLPMWGHRTLVSITRRELGTWVTQLTEGTAPAAYRSRGSTPSTFAEGSMNASLSPSGIKHLIQIVNGVMRWAVDGEILRSSPSVRLSAPRVVKDAHIYLGHAEVARLAQSALDTTGRRNDGTLVLFLAYTGLRINEALALRISSIDLAARRVVVREAWTSDKAGRMVLGSPKSGKSRQVALPAFLVGLVAELVAGRGAEEHVFTAARGGPMSDHNWRTRVFTLARDAAGLPAGLTPHKLRHTAASMAIGAGADVKLVQQMLGHTDAAETLNTYAHLWPDRLDTIADALDAAREASLGDAGGAHVPKMSPMPKQGEQEGASHPSFPR